MRICHGLVGDCLDVEDQEFQWRKPVDVLRQRACGHWGVNADDLILLSGTGGLVGSRCTPDDLVQCKDVFLFLRNFLDPKFDVAAEELIVDAAALEASVHEHHSEDELLRLKAMFGDPAFETFRSNIAEARRWLSESRTISALAAQTQARVKVQQSAAHAVMENLTSHQSACSRSMSQFFQKYDRVKEKVDHSLENVEASMVALRSVTLHPSIRASGKDTLADAVPRDRILQFTGYLNSESARLAHRLDKLRQQELNSRSLCDKVIERMKLFLQDEAAGNAAMLIQQEHSRAEFELLPALCGVLPGEGASPHDILEEEKRSAGMLEGLAQACNAVRNGLLELQKKWDTRHATFLQKLREVSYVQSKVRDVEKQAALLEEEINLQRGQAQHLNHLQKMPKAYQKMLREIARRRQFRDRYLAQAEQMRSVLARMVEEENIQRRNFVQRYGCHLPVDLASGLGSLAPAPVVEFPEFDVQLPDVTLASIHEVDPGTGHSEWRLDGAEHLSTGPAPPSRERGSSVSSCSSSLRQGASSAKGSGSGVTSGGGPAGSSGSSMGPGPAAYPASGHRVPAAEVSTSATTADQASLGEDSSNAKDLQASDVASCREAKPRTQDEGDHHSSPSRELRPCGSGSWRSS